MPLLQGKNLKSCGWFHTQRDVMTTDNALNSQRQVQLYLYDKELTVGPLGYGVDLRDRCICVGMHSCERECIRDANQNCDRQRNQNRKREKEHNPQPGPGGVQMKKGEGPRSKSTVRPKLGSTSMVFKKSSPNNKLTLYLSSRDLIVENGTIDKIQGVLHVDPEYLDNKKLYGQVTLTFRAVKRCRRSSRARLQLCRSPMSFCRSRLLDRNWHLDFPVTTFAVRLEVVSGFIVWSVSRAPSKKWDPYRIASCLPVSPSFTAYCIYWTTEKETEEYTKLDTTATYV
ncbi:Phosrestin-1 [Eumeta japonica]|uniref:Phosrestin-1 n=1 Tax=Eumeta variegata TaxID=151549 RepID=A0A4C1Z1X5_EUMVA|nr:Phosrestin-1 [Eumeta japonica]